MPSTAGVISFVRQGVLGMTTLFSLVALGMSAHLISQIQQYYFLTATPYVLGVVVAAISVVTLPVMFFTRRKAFTSMIVVEVVWLYILCILWGVSAGEMLQGCNVYFPIGCIYYNTIAYEMCQDTPTVVTFSFLNCSIFLLYASAICAMAVTAAIRGRGVWLSSVMESFGSGRARPVVALVPSNRAESGGALGHPELRTMQELHTPTLPTAAPPPVPFSSDTQTRPASQTSEVPRYSAASLYAC